MAWWAAEEQRELRGEDREVAGDALG